MPGLPDLLEPAALPRYHGCVAVRVFSNNLPNPTERAELQKAVLSAIGAPSGDWLVQIHENQNSPSWHITIWGPNHFRWTHEFFGLEEQNPLDGYNVIKKTIEDALSSSRLSVYLSYGYPDNKDGFVTELTERLAQELQVQTGLPAELTFDAYRSVQDPTLSTYAEKLVVNAAILVPVMSPSYFQSDHCQKEFELFTGRERQGHRPQISPVYFMTAEEIENRSSGWAQALVRQQFVDLRAYRFDLSSTEGRRAIVDLATGIRYGFTQRWSEKTDEPKTGSEQLFGAAEAIYLESVRLENFRCFEELALDFNRPSSLDGRWTCIAGTNGSGKSTVLQALGLALLGRPLVLELGGERLNRMRRESNLRDQTRSTVDVMLKGAISGNLYSLHLALDGGRGSRDQALEPPSLEPMRQLVIAGYGATRNLSSRVDSGNEHLSFDVRRQITLFDPLSQLSAAEVLLGRQLANWPFLKLFQTVIQQIFDADLQIVLSSPTSGIRFTVSNKEDVDPIDLPDGFRSAAAWIADLCSIWCEKEPLLAENANPADIFGIVLIDEIDLHLHPSLQRDLIPRLRKVFPKVQWIVTTHSPLVLANFDVNEIVALDRDREGNIRELDRQILAFTSDQIYEWLMGTRPMGGEIEEELSKSDEGVGKSQEELARLMRVSPTTDDETAREQVAEFEETLRTLKH